MRSAGKVAPLPTKPARAHARWRDYSLSVVFVGIAVLAQAVFAWFGDQNAPYLFFAPATLLAATFGGVGPGFVATLLGLGFSLPLTTISMLPAQELINAVAETSGLSKKDATKAVDAVFDSITEALRKGDKVDRKSTRLNSSHIQKSRMPSSA